MNTSHWRMYADWCERHGLPVTADGFEDWLDDMREDAR